MTTELRNQPFTCENGHTLVSIDGSPEKSDIQSARAGLWSLLLRMAYPTIESHHADLFYDALLIERMSWQSLIDGLDLWFTFDDCGTGLGFGEPFGSEIRRAGWWKIKVKRVSRSLHRFEYRAFITKEG